MDYSIQTLMLSSLGMNNSLFLTGGQTAHSTNGWIGFQSLDGSVVLGGITGAASGISYLAGKVLPHPTKIYGKITDISLAVGSSGIQLIN